VADLRSRLAEAEGAERTASEAARSARRRHQQQTAALPAAEDAVRAAEQTVTDLR